MQDACMSYSTLITRVIKLLKMAHPEVTIEQGTLRGSTGTDIKGNSFYKFQGIPYAKPPLGQLRFKAPLPPEKWTGIFDATKEGNICYSRDPLKNMEIVGSEDCLVLNVYTKKLLGTTDTKLNPVLVWIHGGGLHWGHGGEEYYGPDFLITEDVVVVTMNYRLGMFGLVSFEDPSLEVPGNAALKDQVMAFKWVQKNISEFGGDPNNVTIFGESAGAASVHLHVLSPMSKGLFHKAVAQSGCALNPWVTGTKGISKLAPAMNLEGADERTVYEALMKKSKEEILEIQKKMAYTSMPNDIRAALMVVVEKNVKEPFLPDDPITIIRSGKFNQVPFMLGYTTAEGIIFDLFKTNSYELPLESYVPHFFGYVQGTHESEVVLEKIKKFYFDGEEPTEYNIKRKYELIGDAQFLYGIYMTIMMHLPSSKHPIYLYRMSIETELNFFKKFIKATIPGVSHLDDCGYLFKNFATPEIKHGSLEDISMAKFIKLWTNFAKYGNPTPNKNDSLLKVTWKPVESSNLDFLDIGKDLVPLTNPDSERIEFWKQVFAESPAGQKKEFKLFK